MNVREHSKGTLFINGKKLYFEEAGEGETVILLHAHSVDSRMWNAQFEALGNHYRVIRYDLRGYGKSEMPDQRRFFRHIDDLIGLMQQLHVSKAHLVGLSLGSMLAVDCLALHPEKVLSVSVAGSGLYVTEKDQWLPFTESEQSEVDSAAKEVNIASFKQEWFSGLLDSCGQHRDKIKDELWRMIENWSAWQPVYERRWPLVGPSIVKLLRDRPSDLPLLIMIGEEDSIGSRQSSEQLAALISSAETVYLPQSGHMSNMETPELFNHTIISFLHKRGNEYRK
ncbi:alpha/beta fold hydrolase [Paenibacillus prosopidis]|uniref:Pimeloyl-ACP methyl ester carboxylesterase n=1 Tax=Paenibacillus prosopidis TaxID=630520 RepID=A0A368VPH1_9BACL|nr:alpha/beta hydrolase [Paenibacillus prosopidis]RCW41759.1 pimeloyl-ACP methyl ester carboxylesterase [Paenibacillus prosopidis]